MFFTFYKGEKIFKSKLINDYLSKISDDYMYDKKIEKNKLDKYFNLLYFVDDDSIKYYLKKKLLDYVSTLKNRTINNITTIFLSRNVNFGNGLIIINNCIFYCEILGCKNIILNSKQTKRRWLIRNPFVINDLNITIIQDSNIKCENDQVLCLNEVGWNIYYPTIILPQVRTNFIKNEILRNLPFVNIDNDSLYIHIRGGDVFGIRPHASLAQPPLCFYEKIININYFKNIYIVSMDKLNPIVNALLKKYKNIIHNVHHFEYDISLLCHAYNLVPATSSFSISSIKLNDNLKNIWEYDSIRMTEKIYFLHYHLYKMIINFKIHTMRPSNKYLSEMFAWHNSNEQIKLMLEDNCPYDFIITEPII